VTRGWLPEGGFARPERRWDCRSGTPLCHEMDWTYSSQDLHWREKSTCKSRFTFMYLYTNHYRNCKDIP